MSDTKKLVVVVTNGLDNDRSSVAWNVANGGIASGFQFTMFLVSSGVDWVRKRGADMARLDPLDPPVKEMTTWSKAAVQYSCVRPARKCAVTRREISSTVWNSLARPPCSAW